MFNLKNHQTAFHGASFGEVCYTVTEDQYKRIKRLDTRGTEDGMKHTALCRCQLLSSEHLPTTGLLLTLSSRVDRLFPPSADTTQPSDFCLNMYFPTGAFLGNATSETSLQDPKHPALLWTVDIVIVLCNYFQDIFFLLKYKNLTLAHHPTLYTTESPE